MNLYDVLRKPLITETSTGNMALGKYTFKVAAGATKPMIAAAVEKAFKVTVTKVNVSTVQGKTKRMGKNMYTQPSWKKAVVTLKAGDKIELFEGV